VPPRFFRVVRAYEWAALGPVSLALCFRNSSGEINEQSNNNPIFPLVNTGVLFLYGGL
jgi:hypothetical protein